MIERRSRQRLLLEAPKPIRVLGEISWQNLNDDISTQASVTAAIDFAIPPAPSAERIS